MKEVLKPLKLFELAITNSSEAGIGDIPDCRDYLANNKLRDFVSVASSLRTLMIKFDMSGPCSPIDFQNLVQPTIWPDLRKVCFEGIDATQKDFVNFFKRHSSTIQSITLRSIRLMNGEWVDLLETMQECLNLKEAYFGYGITGNNPSQYWNLGPYQWASPDDVRFQSNRVRLAIEEYLVKGGSCPLRNTSEYPQGFFD